MFNEKNSVITIIFIWLVGISIAIPFLFMAEQTGQPAQCHLQMKMIHIVYVVILNIILIFLPTIGLSFLYIFIIIMLRKHYKLFSHKEHDMNDQRLRVHSFTRRQTKIKNHRYTSKFNYPRSSMPMKSQSSGSDDQSSSSRQIRANIRSVSLNSNTLNHNCNRNDRKVSKSCTFCFSSLNKRYECRCNIGHHKIPSQYFNNTNNLVVCYTNNTNFSNLISKQPKYCNNNNAEPEVNICTQIKQNESATYSKLNFTIVISLVTLVFFCCQIPARIFLLWSYLRDYIEPPLIIIDGSADKNEIHIISIVSNVTSFVFFLHCISNPIIYNILSIKFRKAFLSLGLSKKSRLFKFSCRFPCSR